MPHIVEDLLESHRKVDHLLAETALSDKANLRLAHFRLLKSVLRDEMALKEQKLYPAVAKCNGTAAFVVKVALGDHFEINLLIDSLERTGAGSEEFLELLLDLEEALEAHRGREVNEIFNFLDKRLLRPEQCRHGGG